MRIKEVIRKARFSKESIYLLAGFKSRDKFEQALFFHEMKTAILVGLLIVACQGLLLLVLKLV